MKRDSKTLGVRLPQELTDTLLSFAAYLDTMDDFIVISETSYSAAYRMALLEGVRILESSSTDANRRFKPITEVCPAHQPLKCGAWLVDRMEVLAKGKFGGFARKSDIVRDALTIGIPVAREKFMRYAKEDHHAKD